MIAAFVWFFVSLTLMIWGFYAVSQTTVSKNEKLLWKIMFFITPPLTFLLFKIKRVEHR